MSKLFIYLHQPYPKKSNNWITVFTISLFVFLFLFVYQPFGFNSETNENVFIVSIGFAGVTFGVLLFHLILIESIFKNFFSERKWNIIKELIWLIWVIFAISVGNALFEAIISDNWQLSIDFILKYLKYTLAVAFIPILVMIITRQHFLFRRYNSIAKEIKSISLNEEMQTTNYDVLILTDINANNKYEFNIDSIYYIESTGNYVKVFYFGNSELKNQIIRNTLTNISESLSYNKIVRCHRAYIVNLEKIDRVEGNAQGLKLYLKGANEIIPVSRKYVQEVKEKLAFNK